MHIGSLKKRLTKIERGIFRESYATVIIVDTESEIEKYRDKIGPKTIVINQCLDEMREYINKKKA
jgi:hypothetical protein